MKQCIILLTGCIDPGGMHMTVLTDTEKRKAQYLNAIRFYIRSAGAPVLFVENSGNDISSEFPDEIERKQLEIVTFNGNDFDKKKGKGYGEMLIIEEAIRSSSLFNQADFIFKATGRYKVLNISSFLKAFHKKLTDAFFMVNLKPDLSLGDSRFFGAQPAFFEHFLVPYREQLDDQKQVYFETAIAYAVHEAVLSGKKYASLPHYPRYSAESGTGGGIYNDSWSRWIVKEALLQFQYQLQNAFSIR